MQLQLQAVGYRRTAMNVLRTVSSHVRTCPSAAPEFQRREGRLLPGGTANGLGLQVSQEPDGSVSEAGLQHVLIAEAEAVTRKDYRTAGHCHQLHKVLSPSSKLTIEQCSPETLEGRVAFFQEHGFVVIPKVLQGEELSRAQAAWSAVMNPAWEKWEAERAKGKGYRHAAGGGFAEGTNVARRYFDLPGPLSATDDIFVELMDHPLITPVVNR
eukprot:SAG11_NODE_11926_length_731_cov_0.895570_1_plen_212_part_10